MVVTYVSEWRYFFVQATLILSRWSQGESLLQRHLGVCYIDDVQVFWGSVHEENAGLSQHDHIKPEPYCRLWSLLISRVVSGQVKQDHVIQCYGWRADSALAQRLEVNDTV